VPHIVVTGYIKVAAEDRQSFVMVLQAHVPRVRKKSCCIPYTFAGDILDLSLIRMSAGWRDQKSLEAHLADDEFR
jgi:quinol monooxygenase YgiN